MDVRPIQLLALLSLLSLVYATPSSAYEQPGPNYQLPTATIEQPLRFTLTPPKILTDTPKPYGLDIELHPTADGSRRLAAYPSLKLTPQSSVSLSLKNFRPRLNFERGGFKTSLRLRGDGIKLNIRPSDPEIRLEFDIKITDDESRLDCKYRF
ncbi:hypothetical protein [Oceanisphaera arctica]|uniref:Uncharacterized protein n=1 Tax=Oceanisphaera arctica TaxID=641510 RepID=A0A2P5TRH7_9GAMM|nr:hypothetical protein [Oceanisphaera arctica]PPL18427.1 hypothetical protein UN63_00335 [Oceanisphaera arctica]GHA24430.1 hypothetical protein GCM10007082_26330 [Oceanisphaera arctica]